MTLELTGENNRHWLPDVALAADRAHTRNDRTAENIARLRRIALNLLRADPAKGSIRLKVKKSRMARSLPPQPP